MKKGGSFVGDRRLRRNKHVNDGHSLDLFYRITNVKHMHHHSIVISFS